MGDGSLVSNAADLYTFSGKPSKRRFAARADAANDDVYFLEADDISLVAQELTNFGRGKRCALLCSRKSKRPRRGPCDGVPFFVGQEYFRIIVRCVDMQSSFDDVFLGDARQ